MNSAEASTQGIEAPQGASDPSVSRLNKALEQANIAEELGEEKLDKIGTKVWEGYDQDLKSKSGWDKQVDEWVKLAAQIKSEKNYPWPKASNVKYPLLATAAMQFAARAYPSLVPADGKIVQFRVVGADPTGMKSIKADKLAKHMNYQLLEDMEDWEEEMDKLLIQLPIVGCLFKKTYFDSVKKKNASKLIGPKDLVVNYWATSLSAAHRKTEIIPMTKNEIQVYRNAGLYLDVDIATPANQPNLPSKSDVHGNTSPSLQDDTTPYVVLEQHTFWDLDDDGYQEPYIITIEERSKKVLRIVARFDSDGIITNDEGDLVCITPVEYYTKYSFIPNPDGGFYDIGFGHLLGPMNESVNTLINQLVDAGTLSNLQAGFLGKGLRAAKGDMKFQPGEWKTVNSTIDDLKKQIFPLPVRDPSEVLFKLLSLEIDSGRELASIAEIFTGKMPGQNTPATTTQATIEQGMKVFTAIYKRVYRSLTHEFKKVFRLNSLYQENFEKAKLVLDEEIGPMDYDIKSYDVCPTADPTAVSTTQKQQKAEMLMNVVPLGLNMAEVKKRILEAQEQPNINALLMDEQGQPIQPPPDPKMVATQAKIQGDQQKVQMEMQRDQQKMQMEKEEHKMEMAFKQWEAQMDMKMKMFEQKIDQAGQMMQMHLDKSQMTMESQHMQQEHKQTMQQGEEAHKMKMTQMKETGDAKQRAMAGMDGKRGNTKSKTSGSK